MIIALLNIAYYPNVEGGAEISTQKLAETLALNNEVHVVCHGDIDSVEKINAVTVHRTPVRIPFHNKLEKALTRNYKLQCYASIKKILKEISPDVLHTNNLHAFSVIVWRIAHELNIPIVHTLRDYTLLGGKYHEKFIINHCSNYVNGVTAPSVFTLEKFLEKGMFKKTKYKKAIPNAIDFSADETNAIIREKRIRSNDEKIRFAYIGRYSPEKGVDWLVRVFCRLSQDAELHLYGKGKLELSTLSLIENNINIFDHGFLTEDCLRTELIRMDVVVAPSIWDEPFGRVILDGYRCGCPVIVTQRGGMPEVVINDSTGVILEKETDACLEEALTYMSNRDVIHRMMGSLTKKLEQYSIEIQADDFIGFYEVCRENRNNKQSL